MAKLIKFPSELANLTKYLTKGSVGFSIIDLENAIKSHDNNEKIFTRFFDECNTNKYHPIFVGKVSNLARLKTRIPDVTIPNDVVYYFIHGNNKTCSDDAFILELYHYLSFNKIPTLVYSRDKFNNRKSWNTPRVMISNNENPKRPRNPLLPGVINYLADRTIIESIDLGSNHIKF
jgi:anthranilate/para-aminobenzoate synthase component II